MRDFAEAASPEDISLPQEISHTRRQEARKAAKTGIRTEKTEDATVVIGDAFGGLTQVDAELVPYYRRIKDGGDTAPTDA